MIGIRSDCATTPSQSWSKTLAPTSTQTSSTTATPQLQLRITVSTHLSGSSLDATTQTVQLSSTLPQDASTQATPHSATTKVASTQFSISDFFQRCLSERDLSRRTIPLIIHRDVGCIHGSSNSSGHRIPSLSTTCAPTRASPRVLKVRSSHRSCACPPIPTAWSPFTDDRFNPALPSIAQQPQASTTLVGQRLPAACSVHVRTASTALAGMQLATRAAACVGLGPFTRPASAVLRGTPPQCRHSTSCTISVASDCSSGIQVQPARIRHKF